MAGTRSSLRDRRIPRQLVPVLEALVGLADRGPEPTRRGPAPEALLAVLQHVGEDPEALHVTPMALTDQCDPVLEDRPVGARASISSDDLAPVLEVLLRHEALPGPRVVEALEVPDEDLAVLDELLRVVGLLQALPEGPEDRSGGHLTQKILRNIEASRRMIGVEVPEALQPVDIVPCLRARRIEGRSLASMRGMRGRKGPFRPSRAARGRLPPRDHRRIGRVRANRRRRGQRALVAPRELREVHHALLHALVALALAVVEALALALAVVEEHALLAELALGGEETLHPEGLEGRGGRTGGAARGGKVSKHWRASDHRNNKFESLRACEVPTDIAALLHDSTTHPPHEVQRGARERGTRILHDMEHRRVCERDGLLNETVMNIWGEGLPKSEGRCLARKDDLQGSTKCLRGGVIYIFL